jgi:GntR family transcriptional regulator
MPDPMYRQIAEQLRDEIESGQFDLEQPLPTESQLQISFKASRNTVRQAIDLLTRWGLIETRPGSGTFLRQQLEPFVTTLSGEWQPESESDSGLGGGEGTAAFNEVEARGLKGDFSPPRVEMQKASKNVADRLRIPEGSDVISRHQQRSIGGEPWSLQTSYYPMRLLQQGATKLIQADDIEEGTVKYLSEVLQLKQVGYRDRITVRRATAEELRFFRLQGDAGIPVLFLLRTAYAVDDNSSKPYPFRFTESVFPSDRNQFVINVGEVPDRLAEAAEV